MYNRHMKKTFVNLTNHPSDKWSREQTQAAEQYGRIIDLPFPSIDPSWSSDKIDHVVEEYYQKVLSFPAPTVLLQGEFIFTFRLVTRLKKAGICVLAAESRRKTYEEVDADGNSIKKSIFVFEGLKEY